MERDAFHVSYLSDKIPYAVFHGQAVKTVAYLRVSTAQEDVRSQRLAILEYARQHDFRIVGIPLIVIISSGIMNTDSGHREHSPERSDGLAETVYSFRVQVFPVLVLSKIIVINRRRPVCNCAKGGSVFYGGFCKQRWK